MDSIWGLKPLRAGCGATEAVMDRRKRSLILKAQRRLIEHFAGSRTATPVNPCSGGFTTGTKPPIVSAELLQHQLVRRLKVTQCISGAGKFQNLDRNHP